jgi:peroxiredoxin
VLTGHSQCGEYANKVDSRQDTSVCQSVGRKFYSVFSKCANSFILTVGADLGIMTQVCVQSDL